MTSSSFSALFLVALGVGLLCRLWLARRQAAHVAAHRAAVPGAFAATISLDAHQKAADYTVARVRLGMVDTLISAALLLALTPWALRLPLRDLGGRDCATLAAASRLVLRRLLLVLDSSVVLDLVLLLRLSLRVLRSPLADLPPPDTKLKSILPVSKLALATFTTTASPILKTTPLRSPSMAMISGR